MLARRPPSSQFRVVSLSAALRAPPHIGLRAAALPVCISLLSSIPVLHSSPVSSGRDLQLVPSSPTKHLLPLPFPLVDILALDDSKCIAGTRIFFSLAPTFPFPLVSGSPLPRLLENSFFWRLSASLVLRICLNIRRWSAFFSGDSDEYSLNAPDRPQETYHVARALEDSAHIS
ncbi:hypothetical protein C8R45DRAFT_1106924 [Mycena sanguinolenta]|nr:hypothetical protein C8R45DRAFT_1106924 [Mycena sanguinolenta]